MRVASKEIGGGREERERKTKRDIEFEITYMRVMSLAQRNRKVIGK